MNIAEKKRAEQMVTETLGKGPARSDYAADPEAPAKLVKQVRDAFKAAEDAGFNISRHYSGKLEDESPLSATSEHPDIKAAALAYEEAQRAHTSRQRTLIAKVWGDEFDFDTLRVELSK